MAKKGVGGGFIPHLGVVLYPRPKGRGTQSHGCGPLAARYYRLGGVWPADHGGLVCGLVPPPPPAHGTSAEGVRALSLHMAAAVPSQ